MRVVDAVVGGDHEQGTVGGAQPRAQLADEVGVPGGVDQVDLDAVVDQRRARASEIDRSWDCSDSSKSHTVVPSRTEPARGTAPAEASSVSTSVVLPEPPGPTRTTFRIRSGLLASRSWPGWSPGASLVRHRAPPPDQRQLLFARRCKGYPGTVRVTTLSVMSRVVGRRHPARGGAPPPAAGRLASRSTDRPVSARAPSSTPSSPASTRCVLRANGAAVRAVDAVRRAPGPDRPASPADLAAPARRAPQATRARAGRRPGERRAAVRGQLRLPDPARRAHRRRSPGAAAPRRRALAGPGLGAACIGYARRRLVGRVGRGRHRRPGLRHRRST